MFTRGEITHHAGGSRPTCRPDCAVTNVSFLAGLLSAPRAERRGPGLSGPRTYIDPAGAGVLEFACLCDSSIKPLRPRSTVGYVPWNPRERLRKGSCASRLAVSALAELPQPVRTRSSARSVTHRLPGAAHPQRAATSACGAACFMRVCSHRSCTLVSPSHWETTSSSSESRRADPACLTSVHVTSTRLASR